MNYDVCILWLIACDYLSCVLMLYCQLMNDCVVERLLQALTQHTNQAGPSGTAGAYKGIVLPFHVAQPHW